MRMTDQNQNVVWEGEFTPFGEAISITGIITNNLRFPGQYYDAETGLNYNYFRDYNPVVGRYVQADPIGINEGANHLFTYVDNNPILRTDPTGEMAAAEGVAAAGAALWAAFKRCMANKACKCRLIYASYKSMCGIGCNGATCAVVTVQTAAAALCYTLRELYIAYGCDKVIPTTKDHPGAAAQAKRAWQNCEAKRVRICGCGGL